MNVGYGQRQFFFLFSLKLTVAALPGYSLRQRLVQYIGTVLHYRKKIVIYSTNAKCPPPQCLQSVTLCFDCFQDFASIPQESSAIQRTARTNCPGLGSCQPVPQSIFFTLLLWENMQGRSAFNPCFCKQISFCPSNFGN